MIKFYSEIDLSDFIVIIPSIGVGNVAQLAVDLVVSNLQLQKCGSIWHQAIVQLIGPSAYEHEEDSTTAAELYICQEKKLLVVQIRAPIVPNLAESFFDDLVTFFQEKKINRVYILTSSYAHEKHEVTSSSYAYASNNKFQTDKATMQKIESLGWVEYDLMNVIHGGGYAKRLLKSMESLEALILFKYVSEGDNRPEARQLLLQLNTLLNILPEQIKYEDLIVPSSWRFLYGNPPDIE